LTLSIAYFPPIEYFAVLAKYSDLYLEAHEHYQKQSYRNRCRILTAGGVEDLNVPVVHGKDLFSTCIKDVLVDYETPWVLRTERAIEAAYSSSPFFIYYKDELFGILDSHPATLWELDMKLIDFFCRKIGIKPRLTETPEFTGEALDIHPKRSNTILSDFGIDRCYWQVFKDKFGFVPGLSIMDLLFNEGPESICYLL